MKFDTAESGRSFDGLAGARVVAAGGGGFIGTNLIRALLACGAEVTGYGRPPRFPSAIAGARWVEGELDCDDRVGGVIQGADVVYHLAGSASPAVAERSITAHASSNLLGAIRFYELCADRGVARVVSVSSGGTVYGPGAPLPSPETAPTNPTNSYGVAKVAIEQYLALFDRRRDLVGVSLRVANPYGPFQLPRYGQGLVAAVLERVLDGQPVDIYGDGGTIRDYIHIADVVGAMLAAGIYTGPRRVFNVGSGHGRTVSQVLGAIERVLGVPIQINRKPPRPVDIPASVLDITRPQAELGWSPVVPFEAGLRDTFAWMRSNRTSAAVEPRPPARRGSRA